MVSASQLTNPAFICRLFIYINISYIEHVHLSCFPSWHYSWSSAFAPPHPHLTSCQLSQWLFFTTFGATLTLLLWFQLKKTFFFSVSHNFLVLKLLFLKVLNYFLNLCVWVLVPFSISVPHESPYLGRPEKGIRSPGSEVTGSSEPLIVAAGNQTEDLLKNSKYSYLPVHLFTPSPIPLD